MPEKPEASQRLALWTSHHTQTCSMLRVAAETGAFHLQLQRWDTSESSVELERGHITDLHIPPSRLRDNLLLAERVNRGAGRSIMELAWRVWAWVRPLYRNLEPKTGKRRDEGGSTVWTLGDHSNTDWQNSQIHLVRFTQLYSSKINSATHPLTLKFTVKPCCYATRTILTLIPLNRHRTGGSV